MIEEVKYIPLTINYEGVRDHGLRILRDEVSQMHWKPADIELEDVVSMLAGISLALGSVTITQETLVVRDAIEAAMDRLGDKSRALQQAQWEKEYDND